MRHIAAGVRIFMLLVVPVVAFASPTFAQDHSPLMGAWVVTAWESPDGEEDSSPQPGLFLFTQNHYSITMVDTDEARPVLAPGEATEAQLVAAWRPFTANSGRYEVSGDQITRQAYVAKNPGVMAGSWRFPENGQAIQFHVTADGETLHLTFGNGSKTTLRQVDGSEM
jgi:hypothetical protein